MRSFHEVLEGAFNQQVRIAMRSLYILHLPVLQFRGVSWGCRMHHHFNQRISDTGRHPKPALVSWAPQEIVCPTYKLSQRYFEPA